MNKNKNSKFQILGIIPARGGSKGLLRKNVAILCGRPLIAWTIEKALKSKHLDKVIISTESEDIIKISRKYGAEVIKRPKELARDSTPTIDVVFHILDIMKRANYNPNIIVLLQLTSPLRTTEDIDIAIELFLNRKCKSLVSVCEIEHSPYWNFRIEKGYLKSIFGEEYLKKRRQNLPKAYVPNGSIYISTPEILYNYKSFYSDETIPYIMPIERSIDIDNEIDFLLADILIKKYKVK